MAIDASGDLFEADEGSGTIYKFTPQGVKSTFATGVGQPYGLAIDSSGNLFVSDVSANSRSIYEFTPSGNRTTFATGFLFPAGLAFDSAGNLYVADYNRIEKVTPSGRVSTFASASDGAVSLAFSPAGDLYLTTDQTSIYKYAPAGSQSLFGSVPQRSGGIAIDASGNVYVGDRGQREIGDGTLYMFTPAGSRSTLATGLNDPQGTFVIAAVPEPSSWVLAIIGGLCFAGVAVRGRNARHCKGRTRRCT